jgi:putative oxidoreductase
VGQPNRILKEASVSLPAKRIAALDLSARQVDVGLLVLRVVVGLSIFGKHGFEKVAHISHGLQTFGDPIGVGHVPSFLVAMISDGICSLLVVLGLFTRWSAILAAFNVFVAWAAVQHFNFFTGARAEHGELMVLYIAAFLCLFFTGPGRYSLDEVLFGLRKSRASEQRSF